MREWGLRSVALAALMASLWWLVAEAADATGRPAGILLPLSGTVAAAVVAALAGTEARAAAVWFAVAAVGQAVSLSLVEAGLGLRYQHYPPLSDIAAQSPWALAWLAAQGLIVAVGGWRWLHRSRGARRHVSGVRLAIALLLSTIAAATVSPVLTRYLAELVLAASVQLLMIATVVLMVASIPAAMIDRIEHVVGRAAGGAEATSSVSGWPRDRFAWVAAAAVALTAALLSVISYERHPHVPDEVVYLIHARYLAEGWLTLPLPPVAEAFNLDLMSYEATRWFSPVPPGWPFVLAVGAFLDVPWLVNPVLGGVNILLGYAVLSALYPRRVARYATIMLAASPWSLFLAMSFMTHTLTLTLVLLAALGVIRARSQAGVAWGALAGAAVGATSLIRPLDGVVIGALIGLWAIGAGGRRLRLPALSGVAAGTLVVGSLGLAYNWTLTGDPLTFPINQYADAVYGPGANAFGFGPDRGLGWPIDPNPGHAPVDGLINTNLNVFGLNTDLLGWATGSLVLLAAMVCFGAWERADRLMLAAAVAVAGAYFFYYFSGGPDFGARYWFPMVVPLVALSARGLVTLERMAGPRATVAAVALTVMAVSLFVPWRAVDKYHHFRGMRADVRTLAAEHDFTGALVLVRGQQHPDFASAAVYNAPDLEGVGPVYAWDRDETTRQTVFEAFPARPVWILDGPTVTGDGYRVAAGPIAPAERGRKALWK